MIPWRVVRHVTNHAPYHCKIGLLSLRLRLKSTDLRDFHLAKASCHYCGSAFGHTDSRSQVLQEVLVSIFWRIHRTFIWIMAWKLLLIPVSNSCFWIFMCHVMKMVLFCYSMLYEIPPMCPPKHLMVWSRHAAADQDNPSCPAHMAFSSFGWFSRPWTS